MNKRLAIFSLMLAFIAGTVQSAEKTVVMLAGNLEIVPNQQIEQLAPCHEKNGQSDQGESTGNYDQKMSCCDLPCQNCVAMSALLPFNDIQRVSIVSFAFSFPSQNDLIPEHSESLYRPPIMS